MTRSRRREPFINAPPALTALSLFLIVLHAVRIILPDSVALDIVLCCAIDPERFWEWWGRAGAPAVWATSYQSPYDALAPLVLSAFVHADWMHVLLNAAFLLAIGKPVMRQISVICHSGGMFLVGILFLLFFLSQACGAAVFLLLNYPVGPVAVGASGGLSGLLGAFLLLREGRAARLLAPEFLRASAVILVANFLLAFIGPALLSASIAWEVHLGGYLGGALLARLVIAHGSPPPQ